MHEGQSSWNPKKQMYILRGKNISYLANLLVHTDVFPNGCCWWGCYLDNKQSDEIVFPTGLNGSQSHLCTLIVLHRAFKFRHSSLFQQPFSCFTQ